MPIPLHTQPTSYHFFDPLSLVYLHKSKAHRWHPYNNSHIYTRHKRKKFRSFSNNATISHKISHNIPKNLPHIHSPITDKIPALQIDSIPLISSSSSYKDVISNHKPSSILSTQRDTSPESFYLNQNVKSNINSPEYHHFPSATSGFELTPLSLKPSTNHNSYLPYQPFNTPPSRNFSPTNDSSPFPSPLRYSPQTIISESSYITSSFEFVNPINPSSYNIHSSNQFSNNFSSFKISSQLDPQFKNLPNSPSSIPSKFSKESPPSSSLQTNQPSNQPQTPKHSFKSIKFQNLLPQIDSLSQKSPSNSHPQNISTKEILPSTSLPINQSLKKTIPSTSLPINQSLKKIIPSTSLPINESLKEIVPTDSHSGIDSLKPIANATSSMSFQKTNESDPDNPKTYWLGPFNQPPDFMKPQLPSPSQKSSFIRNSINKLRSNSEPQKISFSAIKFPFFKINKQKSSIYLSSKNIRKYSLPADFPEPISNTSNYFIPKLTLKPSSTFPKVRRASLKNFRSSIDEKWSSVKVRLSDPYARFRYEIDTSTQVPIHSSSIKPPINNKSQSVLSLDPTNLPYLNKIKSSIKKKFRSKSFASPSTFDLDPNHCIQNQPKTPNYALYNSSQRRAYSESLNINSYFASEKTSILPSNNKNTSSDNNHDSSKTKNNVYSNLTTSISDPPNISDSFNTTTKNSKSIKISNPSYKYGFKKDVLKLLGIKSNKSSKLSIINNTKFGIKSPPSKNSIFNLNTSLKQSNDILSNRTTPKNMPFINDLQNRNKKLPDITPLLSSSSELDHNGKSYNIEKAPNTILKSSTQGSVIDKTLDHFSNLLTKNRKSTQSSTHNTGQDKICSNNSSSYPQKGLHLRISAPKSSKNENLINNSDGHGLLKKSSQSNLHSSQFTYSKSADDSDSSQFIGSKSPDYQSLSNFNDNFGLDYSKKTYFEYLANALNNNLHKDNSSPDISNEDNLKPQSSKFSPNLPKEKKSQNMPNLNAVDSSLFGTFRSSDSRKSTYDDSKALTSLDEQEYSNNSSLNSDTTDSSEHRSNRKLSSSQIIVTTTNSHQRSILNSVANDAIVSKIDGLYVIDAEKSDSPYNSILPIINKIKNKDVTSSPSGVKLSENEHPLQISFYQFFNGGPNQKSSPSGYEHDKIDDDHNLIDSSNLSLHKKLQQIPISNSNSKISQVVFNNSNIDSKNYRSYPNGEPSSSSCDANLTEDEISNSRKLPIHISSNAQNGLSSSKKGVSRSLSISSVKNMIKKSSFLINIKRKGSRSSSSDLESTYVNKNILSPIFSGLSNLKKKSDTSKNKSSSRVIIPGPEPQITSTDYLPDENSDTENLVKRGSVIKAQSFELRENSNNFYLNLQKQSYTKSLNKEVTDKLESYENLVKRFSKESKHISYSTVDTSNESLHYQKVKIDQAEFSVLRNDLAGLKDFNNYQHSDQIKAEGKDILSGSIYSNEIYTVPTSRRSSMKSIVDSQTYSPLINSEVTSTDHLYSLNTLQLTPIKDPEQFKNFFSQEMNTSTSSHAKNNSKIPFPNFNTTSNTLSYTSKFSSPDSNGQISTLTSNQNIPSSEHQKSDSTELGQNILDTITDPSSPIKSPNFLINSPKSHSFPKKFDHSNYSPALIQKSTSAKSKLSKKLTVDDLSSLTNSSGLLSAKESDTKNSINNDENLLHSVRSSPTSNYYKENENKTVLKNLPPNDKVHNSKTKKSADQIPYPSSSSTDGYSLSYSDIGTNLHTSGSFNNNSMVFSDSNGSIICNPPSVSSKRNLGLENLSEKDSSLGNLDFNFFNDTFELEDLLAISKNKNFGSHTSSPSSAFYSARSYLDSNKGTSLSTPDDNYLNNEDSFKKNEILASKTSEIGQNIPQSLIPKSIVTEYKNSIIKSKLGGYNFYKASDFEETDKFFPHKKVENKLNFSNEYIRFSDETDRSELLNSSSSLQKGFHSDDLPIVDTNSNKNVDDRPDIYASKPLYVNNVRQISTLLLSDHPSSKKKGLDQSDYDPKDDELFKIFSNSIGDNPKISISNAQNSGASLEYLNYGTKNVNDFTFSDNFKSSLTNVKRDNNPNHPSAPKPTEKHCRTQSENSSEFPKMLLVYRDKNSSRSHSCSSRTSSQPDLNLILELERNKTHPHKLYSSSNNPIEPKSFDNLNSLPPISKDRVFAASSATNESGHVDISYLDKDTSYIHSNIPEAFHNNKTVNVKSKPPNNSGASVIELSQNPKAEEKFFSDKSVQTSLIFDTEWINFLKSQSESNIRSSGENYNLHQPNNSTFNRTVNLRSSIKSSDKSGLNQYYKSRNDDEYNSTKPRVKPPRPSSMFSLTNTVNFFKKKPASLHGYSSKSGEISSGNISDASPNSKKKRNSITGSAALLLSKLTGSFKSSTAINYESEKNLPQQQSNQKNRVSFNLKQPKKGFNNPFSSLVGNNKLKVKYNEPARPILKKTPVISETDKYILNDFLKDKHKHDQHNSLAVDTGSTSSLRLQSKKLNQEGQINKSNDLSTSNINVRILSKSKISNDTAGRSNPGQRSGYRGGDGRISYYAHIPSEVMSSKDAAAAIISENRKSMLTRLAVLEAQLFRSNMDRVH
ncbi:hypothetical protein AYI69_g945 [Smittium culicis]|uniref:Uncharacterized protein n=1 Tax=Smittium culicis TaxID=133412 RepID=A0A1R1YRQ8_9FUNG|nr:hypothetical protein AYI69_g945 [Smittium culicis]